MRSSAKVILFNMSPSVAVAGEARFGAMVSESETRPRETAETETVETETV